MYIVTDENNVVILIVKVGRPIIENGQQEYEIDTVPDNVYNNPERWNYINGEFIENPNYSIEVLKEKQILKISESKVELAIWLKKNPMIYSDGKYYSVTEEKQSLLNSNLASYERAKAAGIEYPLKWNSTGDECVPWEYADLIALSLAIAAYVAPKVSKQQEIELAIKACKTAEELEGIEISYD